MRTASVAIATSTMGMTLVLDDLKTTLLMPKELVVGFLLQYTKLWLGYNDEQEESSQELLGVNICEAHEN
jgi:hypothetical protein